MALEIAKGKRRRNHRPTISSLRVGSCGWSEVEGLLGRDRRAKVPSCALGDIAAWALTLRLGERFRRACIRSGVKDGRPE